MIPGKHEHVYQPFFHVLLSLGLFAGGTTLTLHQETLMKGDIAYHSESDSSYVPSSSGGGHSHTVTDGVWVGPCKK
jgi:hypothetical protein